MKKDVQAELKWRPSAECKGTDYGPGTAVPAVKGADLHVEPGEFFSLLGPSETGKTTTRWMISGLERSSTGRVWLGDVDITHLTTHRRPIPTVFQSCRVAEFLDRVTVTPFASRVSHQLSGQRRQCVAIARESLARALVGLWP